MFKKVSVLLILVTLFTGAVAAAPTALTAAMNRADQAVQLVKVNHDHLTLSNQQLAETVKTFPSSKKLLRAILARNYFDSTEFGSSKELADKAMTDLGRMIEGCGFNGTVWFLREPTSNGYTSLDHPNVSFCSSVKTGELGEANKLRSKLVSEMKEMTVPENFANNINEGIRLSAYR